MISLSVSGRSSTVNSRIDEARSSLGLARFLGNQFEEIAVNVPCRLGAGFYRVGDMKQLVFVVKNLVEIFRWAFRKDP